MRRWFRYAFNATTALVLLVGGGTYVAWLRDANRTVTVGREWHEPVADGVTVRRTWFFARSSDGLLMFYHCTQVVPIKSTFAGKSRWYSEPSPRPTDPWSRQVRTPLNRRGFGFVAVDDLKNYQAQYWQLIIPNRFVVMLCGLFVSVRVYIWRRSTGRPRTGHCPTCGYDLRATPSRCPECGTTTFATAMSSG